MDSYRLSSSAIAVARGVGIYSHREMKQFGLQVRQPIHSPWLITNGGAHTRFVVQQELNPPEDSSVKFGRVRLLPNREVDVDSYALVLQPSQLHEALAFIVIER